METRTRLKEDQLTRRVQIGWGRCDRLILNAIRWKPSDTNWLVGILNETRRVRSLIEKMKTHSDFALVPSLVALLSNVNQLTHFEGQTTLVETLEGKNGRGCFLLRLQRRTIIDRPRRTFDLTVSTFST